MPATENQTELRLSHRFDAPRERVFEAWTNPEVLKRWFAPGTDWGVPVADVDLRQGGRYRIAMQEPGGDKHTVRGEYTQVTPPERIAYTWAWEDSDDPAMAGDDSQVVVEFLESGDGTEVVLTHTGLPNQQSRDSHAHGWEGIMASFEAHLSRG